MVGLENTSTRISPTQEVAGEVYWVLQGGGTNLWLSQNIPVVNSKTGQIYWGSQRVSEVTIQRKKQGWR